MLKFGVKSVILGSAVYYTIDKGVWKDSSTTSKLYEELEEGVSPYVGELKKQIPYEVRIHRPNVGLIKKMQLPPLPSNDRMTYLFKYYWNSGVKATFRFLIDLPTHATNAASKSYEFINSVIEPVDPAPRQDNEK